MTPKKIQNGNEFNHIFNDLSQYKTNGHERIVIKKSNEGTYYPATAARPRGIFWFFELFTRGSDKRKVNDFMTRFLEQNAQMIEKDPNLDVLNVLTVFSKVLHERLDDTIKKISPIIKKQLLKDQLTSKRQISPC